MHYKTLRVILIWTGSIAAFIFLVLFGVQKYLGPEVKKLFISEINKSLVAEVQIDEVELSLLKDFPFASLRFKGVRMKEAVKPASAKNMLTAGTISLRFNIWDLLHKKYRVKNIMVADIEINARILADGRDNFHFWKEASGSTKEDFHYELQRVNLYNLHIHFLDDAAQTLFDADLPGFVAKGDFNRSNYTLDLAGNIMVHQLKSKGVNYITERNLNIWLDLIVDNKTGQYDFKTGTIETGKLKLSTSGTLLYTAKQKQINLDITASGSTLEEMMSLVPSKYTDQLADYRFEGGGNMEAKLTGTFGDGRTPAVSIQLDVSHGNIIHRSSGISLKEMDARFRYTLMHNGADESFAIQVLKATFGEGFVKGSWLMNGFVSPHIVANLNASLNLGELKQFLRIDAITSMSGWVKLNLAFDGQIEDLSHPVSADFMRSNINGQGKIRQAEICFKNYKLPFKNLESDFVFNGSKLELQKLAFKVGKSDFQMQGSLDNLPAWLFVKDEDLSINGSVQSKRFDYVEISDAQPASPGEYSFSLPKNILINKLPFKCKQMNFWKFTGTDVSGIVLLQDQILTVSSVQMVTNQGHVNGEFVVNARSGTHALLQSKAHLEKVDIKSLFTQFNNFGQNDLVAENLDGRLTADIVFAGLMKNNLEFDLNSLKTHMDVVINNGRLVNYKPMLSLSKFLKVEDLNDIRFETMQNQLDIANQVIYIPAMQVKSSALNLELMGTHTFDNELDYHFSIVLADLLTAKYLKHNPRHDNQAEFGPVEEDNRGRTKVYVSLTGTMDNPIVRYDKRAVREKFNAEITNQKIQVKQILKQEFTSWQGDSLKREQKLKEKAILKKQEEGKFVIEWDDDKK